MESNIERSSQEGQAMFSVVEQEGTKLAILWALWIAHNEDEQETGHCDCDFYSFAMSLDELIELGYAVDLSERGVTLADYTYDPDPLNQVWPPEHFDFEAEPQEAYFNITDDEVEEVKDAFECDVLRFYGGKPGTDLHEVWDPEEEITEEIPCGDYWLEGII